MRWYSLRTLTVAGAGLVILSGCSSTEDPPLTTEPMPTPPAPSSASVAPTPLAPGEVGVSGGGVTTAVGAPAESTEDDYFQACRAARTWMEQQGGESQAQFEPYLETIQRTDSAGPGTFGIPWSELTPGQQSAVIVAVEAAVDRLCG
ncbi:MAG: lipoprotein LpqV [Actinomycetia bacterium]|nr:lipoprotein LpqV [Actinomycetes bacterium]